MQTKLYVGNLNYQSTEDDLRNLFSKFGAVQNVTIVKDRYSGQSKGFAFVEMSNHDDAEKALELNGSDFLGRSINVAEARPQSDRPGGESRRGSGGGGGFHGGAPRGGGGGFGGGRREHRGGGSRGRDR